jgi:hypothetical protein
MSVWFEGTGAIECTIEQVKLAFDDFGEHYVGVVGLMPGLANVELVEQGPDSVTIRTNEGLMTRTNIVTTVEAERVTIEFDEVYEAGSKVTASSHFRDEFASSESGVEHRLVMSDVEAPGFLGFFYRRFGSKKMGNAFLGAYRTYFERRPE